MKKGESTQHPNLSPASNETQRLYTEQVKLLYTNVPASTIATLINSSILVFILWKEIAPTVLIAWLVCLFLTTFFRSVLLYKYKHASVESLKTGRWGAWLTFWIAAVGMVWGAAAIFLFSEESIVHQVFLVFVVGGMMTGAVSSYSVMPRASSSFSLFISIPVIVRVFAQGGDIPIAMGGMMMLFTIVILITSQRMHTTILQSLRLQFENSDMITILAAEKKNVEKLNEELKLEITGHKQTEKALSASENRINAILSSMVDLVFAFDNESRFTFCHSTCIEDIYLSSEKFKGKKHSEVMPAYLNKLFSAAFKRNKQGEVAEYEYWLKKDEQVLWFSAKLSPIFSKNLFMGSVAVIRDVTAHKLAEKELRQHRDHLEELVRQRTADMEAEITERKHAEHALNQKIIELNSFINNIPDMAWLKNADSRFIAVNKAFGTTVGMKPEYLINNNCEVCFGTEAAGNFREDDLKVMAGRKQVVIEENITDYRGREVWLETIKSPIFSESGEVVGTVGIARDVTERKRLEEQLRQAQKMKAVGTLAGGVAHDFNNLFTGIQGYTDLILMKLNEDDFLYHDVKEIQQSVKQATHLTRQLLLFSRRQPMTMTPLNINTTVRELVQLLNRRIGEDVSITIELAEELRTIEAEPGNIEQVIMSLVGNAGDAIPEGGEILIKTENVRIDEEYCRAYSFARPGNYICLSIKDSGVGMDKQIIEHIFEPFFSTKGLAKGAGLGLSIVYGIINQHQGWINVESAIGKGAIFRIYLPASSARPEEVAKEPVSFEQFRGRGERILLVEDEKVVRECSTRGLVENGYKVFAAANVQMALEIFRKEDGNFDLIFSDVVLPDGRGPRLVEQLVKLKPGINVLFTSGYSDEKADWRTIQKTNYHYLPKPYSLSGLLKGVQAAIKAG
ncbi:MAG: PAS domain S-box protein [Methanosarcinaceae archaeon]